MMVVLSGEGKSDLGDCNNSQGQCQVPDFVHGPMTLLVDQILAQRLHYSMLEVTPAQYIYIRKSQLMALAAQRKAGKESISLTGKKNGQDTGYFRINAWVLGKETLRLQQENGDQAIAILFRDCDDTNSTPAGLWDQKWKAMVEGFARSELGECGVPMLPKPKSEAWLLCAAKAHPYQHCAALEDMSGNDKSPHALKDALDAAYGRELSSAEQVDWLTEHGYDDEKAANQMPSLQKFKERLNAAMTILGLPSYQGV